MHSIAHELGSLGPSASTSVAVLSFENVTRRYKGGSGGGVEGGSAGREKSGPSGVGTAPGKGTSTLALDRLDFRLEEGGCTALLGPNGAGKTTVVRLLAGLSRPTLGRVRLFGRDPRDPGARQGLGVMLQSTSVPETMTVAEHIHLFSSYYADPLPLPRILGAAGLEELGKRRFGRLSGGQKRRVLFALALCGNPSLLVLDEPTVGLDVEARRRMWDELRTLIAEGRTVLLTTHHLEEADALADRIVVLHQGRLLADGSPAQIKSRVAGRRVRCRTSIPLEVLRQNPRARVVQARDQRVEIYTHQAEPLLKSLFAQDPELSELEIVGAGLEEAFLALTEARSADSGRSSIPGEDSLLAAGT